MTVSQRENLMRVASRRPLRAVLALLASSTVLAGLLVAAPPQARADLAASDSFPGWTTTVSGSPEFVVTADTTGAQDGAAAARVDFDSPYSASYVDLRQNIRANGGVTYDMSVWVRTQDLSASDAAYVVLSGDHSQRVELPAGTNGWTRLEWSYTQPAGSMTFVMRFLVRGTGTVWFDDARMSVAGDDENLVVNPSFEQHEPPPGTLAFADTALVYETGDAHVGIKTVADGVAWELRASSGQRLDTGTAAATAGAASIDLSALPAGYYGLSISITAPEPLTRTGTLAVVDPPGSSGPNAHVGVAAHVNRYSVDQIDALMGPLGAGTVREGPSWDTIETSPGVYEFPALFDAQIAAAKARGERPIVILAYFSRWYDGGKTPSSPEGIAAYARYAAAAAEHYGSGVDYEVYNEFNHTFNTGACGMTAACYLELLEPAAAAIHEAAPGARVVGPVSAGARWDFMEDLFALGGLDHLDAVSYHTYDFPGAPEGRTEAGVATLRGLIDEYAPGSDIPIWLSEHGWPTTTGGTTEQQQAAYVVRSAALLQAAGVERSVYYELIDSGANRAEPEHNFGISRLPTGGGTALTPKPAYPALAVYNRQTAGRTLTELRRLDGAVVADFADSAGGVVRMVWATGDPVTVAVETGPSSRLVRGDGRSWRAVPNATVELTVGGDPVYVTGAVGTPAVVADAAAQVDTPDQIPLGGSASVPVTVDRTALGVTGDLSVVGPVGGGVTLTGTGAEVQGVLALEPMREAGERPVAYTVRSGDAVVAYVGDTVEVVQNPVLSFGPVADRKGDVGLALGTRNLPGGAAVDVADVGWTIGEASGTVPAFSVGTGQTATSAIDGAALTPWQPTKFAVSLTAAGETRQLTGTTALAPVAREPHRAAVVDWRARGTYVALSGGTPDADDLGGTFALSWSDRGLRVRAALRDDDHRPSATVDRLWEGDSIQLAVARGLPGQDPASRVELGIHPGETASVYRYTAPAGTVGTVRAKVVRKAGTTTYDVVVPWAELGVDPKDGAFSFSLLANDNDGGTRQGFLEWGSGIGPSKNAALFVPVVPVR
ncbi:sugar-binding protein [Promicromonospora sukumoe]|uniref:sugar-binding protein n=1 Tax=Promicromonospora sukumoe TaxID=88382 RepID=UPI00037B838B|nr:sugar-binding protein [Promicromonospora sukumoe]